jgi:hypothetical protein
MLNLIWISLKEIIITLPIMKTIYLACLFCWWLMSRVYRPLKPCNCIDNLELSVQLQELRAATSFLFLCLAAIRCKFVFHEQI